MSVRLAVVRFERPEAMSWKAEFEGAKIVMSDAELRVEVRFVVALRAPRKAVRLAFWATEERLPGMERRESMMWTTPPVMLRFCAKTH